MNSGTIILWAIFFLLILGGYGFFYLIGISDNLQEVVNYLYDLKLSIESEKDILVRKIKKKKPHEYDYSGEESFELQFNKKLDNINSHERDEKYELEEEYLSLMDKQKYILAASSSFSKKVHILLTVIIIFYILIMTLIGKIYENLSS